MQPVFAAAQSRAFEKYLIEEIGIPSLTLMENAARGALEAMTDWLDDAAKSEIVIICGTGNNGGDGMALARLLIEQAHNVTVFLAGDKSKLSPDAKIQYDILSRLIDPDEIYSFEKSEDIIEIVDGVDIIIDALLGTGSNGMPRGAIAEGVKAIQMLKEALGASVLALDIPSGLDADLGAFEAEESSQFIVRADRTVAMGAAKIGFYQAESRIFTGEIRIASLGGEIPIESLIDGNRTFLLSEKDAANCIHPFAYTASKTTRGRLLTICGSRGMTGAAIMSGMAALKSGCGMVTVAIPESERHIVAEAMPELMTHGLRNETNGSPDRTAWDELQGQLKRADVVLIGCGLPVILGTTAFILKVISNVDKPMVIDAGALGTLTGHFDILKKRTSPTVLTPHAGEIARLVDRPLKEVLRDRLGVAREVAETTGCIVVMKGAPTYIVRSAAMEPLTTIRQAMLALQLEAPAMCSRE